MLPARQRAAHAASSKEYRSDVADDKWPEFLELICGKYVKGGRHEFEVQKRRPRDGGDWTFELSGLG